jgi:hypothetical protein
VVPPRSTTKEQDMSTSPQEPLKDDDMTTGQPAGDPGEPSGATHGPQDTADADGADGSDAPGADADGSDADGGDSHGPQDTADADGADGTDAPGADADGTDG